MGPFKRGDRVTTNSLFEKPQSGTVLYVDSYGVCVRMDNGDMVTKPVHRLSVERSSMSFPESRYTHDLCACMDPYCAGCDDEYLF